MIHMQPLNILQTPPLLCDFEQWIDTEIKKWEAVRLERVEKRRQEEAVEKERKGKKKWKEGMLLSVKIGRTGSGSLSVLAVLKQLWRTIQMH